MLALEPGKEVLSIKDAWTHRQIIIRIHKGNNFCNVLCASLDDKALQKIG